SAGPYSPLSASSVAPNTRSGSTVGTPAAASFAASTPARSRPTSGGTVAGSSCSPSANTSTATRGGPAGSARGGGGTVGGGRHPLGAAVLPRRTRGDLGRALGGTGLPRRRLVRRRRRADARWPGAAARVRGLPHPRRDRPPAPFLTACPSSTACAPS